MFFYVFYKTKSNTFAKKYITMSVLGFNVSFEKELFYELDNI